MRTDLYEMPIERKTKYIWTRERKLPQDVKRISTGDNDVSYKIIERPEYVEDVLPANKEITKKL